MTPHSLVESFLVLSQRWLSAPTSCPGLHTSSARPLSSPVNSLKRHTLTPLDLSAQLLPCLALPLLTSL